MTTVDHGFDLEALRRELDGEEWEDSDDSDMQVRRVYLGSVFGLTPSGKFYMPFACSNVMGCDNCKGTGHVDPPAKRRVVKRWAKRQARTMRRYARRYGNVSGLYGRDDLTPFERNAKAWLSAQPKLFRYRSFLPGQSCRACGGNGSREAHLDELWRESVESAFESIGVQLANGDGDPCDLFAEEYREAEIIDLDPLENEREACEP